MLQNQQDCDYKNYDYKAFKQQHKNCIIATTREELQEALRVKQQEYIAFLQTNIQTDSTKRDLNYNHIDDTKHAPCHMQTSNTEKALHDTQVDEAKQVVSYNQVDETQQALYNNHIKNTKQTLQDNHTEDTKRLLHYSQTDNTKRVLNHNQTTKPNQTICVQTGMSHAKLHNENIDSNIHFTSLDIGFTPTMGALHNGHKSLIESNVAQNHIAVVSLFVNPTQFSPTEDLSTYPRTLERDIEMCREIGVDIVFAPTSEILYTDDDEITIEPPKKMGYILEGYYRPTHFRGVLQVVLKLFNLISPTRAYFGQKDAQQLLIIKKMVQHLCLPIEIIGMPIVRDYDNLALSSRNVYLSESERQLALAIPKTIFHLQDLITQQNIRDIAILKQEAEKILGNLNIDYMDFYNHDLTFATKAQNCIFLLVVRIGKIRLLDNLWIE